MPETALDRLRRILDLLPLAAREGGIPYDELARALGIDRDRLDRDLAEITDRELYHSGDSGGDIQIILDADRVHVWTTGHLRRPTRLSPGEAAALDLGLRILAAEREDEAMVPRMGRLLERVAWTIPDDVRDRVIADGDPGATDAVRALLVDAARRRRRVRFRYLKLDAHATEDRSVDPYTIAYAGGHWYVVGRCPERDGIRIFRTDRILEATVAEADFHPPADFDAADYMAGGQVYQADEEIEVVVRYETPIAPWLLERGEGEPQSDGAVIVRHRVADPAWIVRHVLRYGGEARVLQPAWVAALLRAAVGKVAATDNGPADDVAAAVEGAGT